MDDIPDILDVDNDSLIYWSDEDASNLSGPINDELLSISDDSSQSLSVVSNEGSHPPTPLPMDQQEGAARDVPAPGEGQHDDLDPAEEVEDEEYDLNYSSEGMDSEDEDESEDEELPQGVVDLGNAIQSSDDEEDDGGEQGMPVQGDVPDLRAFHIFAPLVQRPCVDDEGRELPNDVFREHTGHLVLSVWICVPGAET